MSAISELFKSETKSDEHAANTDRVSTSAVLLASTENPDQLQSQTAASPPPVVRQAVATRPPPPTSRSPESESQSSSDCCRDPNFFT